MRAHQKHEIVFTYDALLNFEGVNLAQFYLRDRLWNES